MPSKWATEPLIGVVSYIAKGIPPAYVEVEGDNTVRVLNQKCNRDFAISYTESRLHDLSKRSVPQEKYLRDEDILINSTGTGTAGRIAQLSNVQCPTIVDGHMIVLRGNEKITPRYLGYALKAQQAKVLQLDEGSTGQTELDRGRLLAEIEVSYPISLGEQEAIAATLSTLDARIAENKKINHHLEQMTQAIFKSWFVDFEPFDGEQPSEWQIGSLIDIADYLNGLAMQRFRPATGEVGLPVLKIKELRQGSCDSASELCSPSIRSNYIVHDGDVIFSWSGSLLVDFWCGGDCGLNQHLFKVTSRKYDKWFYYAWTCHHLAQFVAMAADKATTMGHIKREALENAEVIIPDEDSYRQLGDFLAPLYDRVINNRVESRKLSHLRDSLLPKLMTGEISVEGIR